MLNRKRSVSSRARKESCKNVKLNLNESLESEVVETLLEKPRYEDIDKLKIKEDDMVFRNKNDFNATEKETLVVMHLITPFIKEKFNNALILKKMNANKNTHNLKLFSSFYSKSNVNKFDDEKKIKTFTIPNAEEHMALSLKKSNKAIPDYSFNALENWKFRMRERRNLKNSLSKRLQTNPESLLMSQSVQNILFSNHQDDILDNLLPYFNNRAGNPLNQSIWPEKEVTKKHLHLQRPKLNHLNPFNLMKIGYPAKIVDEMDETINKSRKFQKIPLKNKALDKNTYKNILNPYSYKSPDFSELILASKKYNQEKRSFENTTFTTSWAESSFYISESDETSLGPQLLINDEWLFDKSSFNDKIPLQYFTNIHMCFPETHVNREQLQNIHFANKGTCIIQYSWKKLEQKRILRNDDMARTFFFKINKGIILPNSSVIIPVTFKSKIPGFFGEMWELCTEPLLSNKNIIFHFHAISMTHDHLKLERNIIEETNIHFTKHQIAKVILDEIIRYSVFHKKEKEKLYISFNYDEEENFKSLNPYAPWNFDKVQDLKSLCFQNLEIQWNLSLNSLKKILREKYDLANNNSESFLNEFYDIFDEIHLPVVETIHENNGKIQHKN